jgi:uncharacterized protein
MIDFGRIEGFDWDSGNARKNERHAVTQAEAEQVFFDRRLLVVPDAGHSREESRFHTLGGTVVGRLLHVTFTFRAEGTKIRVISARNASRKERLVYEQKG